MGTISSNESPYSKLEPLFKSNDILCLLTQQEYIEYADTLQKNFDSKNEKGTSLSTPSFSVGAEKNVEMTPTNSISANLPTASTPSMMEVESGNKPATPAFF